MRLAGAARLVRASARVALPIVTGGFIACSLPPIGPWFLAPIGLAGLYLMTKDNSALSRARVGVLVGIGQFAIGCAFALEFTAVGYLALVAFESLLVAVACLAIPPRRARTVGFVAAITLLEWVRDAWPFGGMPLGGIALSQSGGPIADLARVGGPLALVVGGAAAGAGLGRLWSASVEAKEQRISARRFVPGASAIGVVAIAAMLGVVAPNGGGAVRTDSVAIVQGGGRRGVTSLEVAPTYSFAATAAVIRHIRAPVDLVVCPEDALALAVPISKSPKASLFASFARRLHATLLAGVTIPVGQTRFLNEIVAFGPSGAVIGRVEKAHPVPFGEYVPLRSVVSKIASLSGVPRDMVVGHNDGSVSTPAGRLASLNSFETFFTGRGRSGVRSRASLLVVETNTSSYATSQAPAMELAASRLQAIAEGRTLVQAATTGYSAIISPDGSIETSSGLGRPDLISARVALRAGTTLYDRFGDAWIVVLALVALAAAWALELMGRRSSSASSFSRVRPR